MFIATPYWFNLNFTARNTSPKRTVAVKLQANLLDAFGSIVETWPIVENTSLGTSDEDMATFGVRKSAAVQSVKSIDLYLLAIKYEDGSVWTSDLHPHVGPTPAPNEKLQRAS